MIRIVTTVSVLALLAASGCGKKSQDKPQEQDNPGMVAEKVASKPQAAASPAKAAPLHDGGTAVIAPLGPCPATTAIVELESAIDISDGGPYAWEQFTIAKAVRKDDGKQLQVFISNRDYPTSRMDGLSTAVSAKGEAVFTLSLYNGEDEVGIGEYRPGGFKKPFTVLAEVQVSKGDKGTFVGLGIDDGVVRVLDMPDGKICGEFEVKSARSLAKGTFVALVE
jgi:hypothetical protein